MNKIGLAIAIIIILIVIAVSVWVYTANQQDFRDIMQIECEQNHPSLTSEQCREIVENAK